MTQQVEKLIDIALECPLIVIYIPISCFKSKILAFKGATICSCLPVRVSGLCIATNLFLGVRQKNDWILRNHYNDKNRGIDMFKVFLVYSHLISACVAIAVIFFQDCALMVKRGRAMDQKEIDDLKRGSNLIIAVLIMLWVSGLALVILGQSNNPEYIMNQKLWAKFTVVSILTLNGLVLHAYSFPVVTSPKGILGSTGTGQLLVFGTAVISLVSWLFACYLGIARHWNNVAPYTYVMSVYVVILSISMIGGLLYLRYWRTGNIPLINRFIKV